MTDFTISEDLRLRLPRWDHRRITREEPGSCRGPRSGGGGAEATPRFPGCIPRRKSGVRGANQTSLVSKDGPKNGLRHDAPWERKAGDTLVSRPRQAMPRHPPGQGGSRWLAQSGASAGSRSGPGWAKVPSLSLAGTEAFTQTPTDGRRRRCVGVHGRVWAAQNCRPTLAMSVRGSPYWNVPLR